MLPNETDLPSVQVGNKPDERSHNIDTLNVFDTDSAVANIGRLYYRETDAGGHEISNPGLALTGLCGRRPHGEPGHHRTRILYFGGASPTTARVVDILLGKGNDTLSIDDTGTRRRPALSRPSNDTAVHGGGGDDTICKQSGPWSAGDHGDTSEDGVSYSNDQPAASVYGTKFNNPGNDTIDASAMPAYNDGSVGVVSTAAPAMTPSTAARVTTRSRAGPGRHDLRGAGNDDVYGDPAFNVNLQLRAGPGRAV